MVQEKTYRIVDRERSDEALHDEGFIEAFAACATMVGTDMVRARRGTGLVPSPASIVFACTKDQLCQ